MKMSMSTRVILACLLAAIGVAAALSGITSFMPVCDEAYQALCVRHYTEAPLAMLSFWTGNCWTAVFGDTLVALRVLMGLCYIVSIAIGCIFLYRRTRALLFSSFTFALMCIAVPFSTLYLYGWDAGAYPFMTLFAIVFIRYIERPGAGRAFVMGIIAALMALSRIPTLAVLPVVAVMIIICRRNGEGIDWRKAVTDCAAGLGGFAIAAAVTICIISGGDFSLYIDSWRHENIINGHFEPGRLEWRWKDCSRRVFLGYYPMLLAFAAAVYVTKLQRKVLANVLFALAAVSVASLMLIKTFTFIDDYAVGILQGMLAALFLLPVLYHCTHTTPAGVNTKMLCALATCSLTAGVGSDGFPERPMAISIIPMVCACLYPRFGRLIRTFMMLGAGALVTVFAFVMNRAYTERPADNISTCRVMSGIRVSGLLQPPGHRFQRISAIIEGLRSRGEDVAIVGKRYLFDYMYNERPSHAFHHFAYADGAEELALLDSLMKRYSHILLVTGAGGGDYPNSERHLRAHGYMLKDSSDSHRLYISASAL